VVPRTGRKKRNTKGYERMKTAAIKKTVAKVLLAGLVMMGLAFTAGCGSSGSESQAARENR